MTKYETKTTILNESLVGVNTRETLREEKASKYVKKQTPIPNDVQ